MKKVLAISSVLLGVVFLAGCGQQPVSQTQPAVPVPVAQTPTQPVATQPAPTTPAVTQNYIEVKELGFKIPVDASMIGDLTYRVSGQGVAFFSKTLSNINKACNDAVGIVHVSKILGKSSDNKDSIFYNSQSTKQFDGFFLGIEQSSNYCAVGPNKPTDIDKKNMNLEDQAKQGILGGLKNAILIAQ